MQKVVGSSPIIRSNKAPLGGVFCCLNLKRRHSQTVATAHRCPFNRPIERFPVRFSHPLTPLRSLRIDAESEARILVAELVSGEADVGRRSWPDFRRRN